MIIGVLRGGVLVVWIADWAWLALCCACHVPRGRPLARLTAGAALYASEMFLQLMTRTCRAAHPMKHYPNDMAVPYPSCIIPLPSLSLMKFIVILFLLFGIIVDVICTALCLARCVGLPERRIVLDEVHPIGRVLREHVLPAALSAVGRLFGSSFWDETNRLTRGRGDVDAAVAWSFRLFGGVFGQ